MDALRAGRAMRKRIFDTIEQRHAHDFGNGSLGKGLYEDLLSAVRDSGAPEAAEEFEERFFPLLNPDRPRGGPDTMKDRWRGGWGWTSAFCVAAVLGALILGFNGFKMIAAERLTATDAPIPVAKEPAPEPMTESIPPMAPGVPIPDAGPASETTTEPAPAIEVEQ